MPLKIVNENVKEVVDHALREKGWIQSGELASTLGISRQAAHAHLRRMTEEGTLRAVGKGRGARYERTSTEAAELREKLSGLEEHEVWKKLESAPPLRALQSRAADIAYFAFTELLNNAIDHSGGQWVEVRAREEDGRCVVDIEDDGEGIFEHVRRLRGLASAIEAAQDLGKGKTTTDPARHTGQGIFFSSKAVDLFFAESDSLRWTVDNLRDDEAFVTIAPRHGTRVRFAIAFDTPRTLKAVFDAYSGEDFAFMRTRTRIKLYETGLAFVSRSEAKRLLHGLEKFEEIVLDFSGVAGVGQGFADEVFRVWARAHPNIRLVPIHMDETVTFMVERARSAK